MPRPASLPRRTLLAAPMLLPAAASAQAFPTRTIRLVSASAPGGVTDTVGRLLAERLAPALGVPVIVENRPGAAGILATDMVARAAPDGHTLFVAADSHIVVNPFVYTAAPSNGLTDLEPVAPLAAAPYVLAVHPSVQAWDLPGFVALARRAADPLPYGSGGVGGLQHLGMEMLMRHAGFPLLHVPFRSGTAAAHALLAGDVLAMMGGGSLAPLLREGRLRPLATTGGARMATFPEVPTIAETHPGFALQFWLGVFAPHGLPRETMTRLRAEIAGALEEPAMRQALLRVAELVPLDPSPAGFARLIAEDAERFRAIVEELGIRPG
ncbi:MAG: tripartite tricarboxylate transporter substrate binding protein [Acetobacteraceae bacterium]|nr:tripartite tricarboxylate transporter substrate binding protein [Acetobacteraceae bacterium]